MIEESTSLANLHDLVLPLEVSWWPLAPGWYALLGLLLLIGIYSLIRSAFRYRANAYRREALRQVATAPDAAGIAELLRRSALAIASREVIAAQSDTDWLDWLVAQSSETMPETVRQQLTTGVYGRSGAEAELNALRDFATRWLMNHHPQQSRAHSSGC